MKRYELETIDLGDLGRHFAFAMAHVKYNGEESMPSIPLMTVFIEFELSGQRKEMDITRLIFADEFELEKVREQIITQFLETNVRDWEGDDDGAA